MLSILILQSVIFARLNIYGVTPDLILVSVIVFAVLQKVQRAAPLAFTFGFLQDILSSGTYINTLTKVFVSFAINTIKENFMGNTYVICLALVACFTPLTLIFEAGILLLFFTKKIILFHLIITIFITTIYNLILLPVLFPIIEKLSYE